MDLLFRNVAESTPPPADQLLLIGRRHLRSNNSWLHNSPSLTTGKERHHLLAHPNDLACRGIESGDTVRVTSASGSVVIEARATDRIMEGVVSIPHGYGHQRDGVLLSVATATPGPSANDLTESAVTDTITATAVFNGVPVTLTSHDE